MIAFTKADAFSDEQKAALRKGFDMFDKDGNGFITAGELGAVVKSLGQEATEEQIKSMISGADLDENGKIDFNEFLKLIANKAELFKK